MLLLRLCLGLAILAGIGVIVMSQVVLKPQFEEIRNTRDTNKKNWDKAESDKKRLNKDLAETQTKLKSTEATLDTTKSALASTTDELNREREKSKGLSMTIEKLKTDLKVREDELAAWKALGYTVDQIAGLIKELNTMKGNNEALIAENKVFKTRIDRLQAEIDDLRGSGADIVMPASAKGKVLVVDPKWDFVVLDVGSSLGVKDKGILLVSRNGSLVAKVRVMNVQPNRCIANILPGWKLKDVMEGDQVFPYTPANTL
jgi:DNA gyrase/topoisomerase IV subunit A